MAVVLSFRFKTILSRKATLIIFKSKSAVSVNEHEIAESVDYKHYKLRDFQLLKLTKNFRTP